MKKHKMLRGALLGLTVLALGCIALPGIAAEGGATIVFAEGQVTTDAEGVAVEGTVATITASGTYRLSGASGQGRVVVNSDGRVELILENLDLASEDGPVIDIQSAKEVTLTLAAGTQNTLVDGAQYSTATDEQDAAIFSRADLVIGGDGALTVQARYNDGIASRDTLRIEGGDITVEALNHGIKGKDNLVISGGVLNVTAGGDAIKATNADQAAMGFVQVDGGILHLTAQDDGISAISQILINGGEIAIDTANNGMKSEGDITINAGTITIVTEDDDFVTETKTISPEAVVVVEERKAR